MRIFVSHTTRDSAIVDALGALHTALFGARVELVRSSDQGAGAGIAPGEQWLQWITDQIVDSDQAYVLLTPNSLSRSWMMWESGAAAGVALATERQRPVVPILFGISADDVPSPLRSAQMVQGDIREPNGALRLLQELNVKLNHALPEAAFTATIDAHLPNYLTSVAEILEGADPMGSLLSTVPSSFPATRLAGQWATSYQFTSQGTPHFHADVAEVVADSARRITARNGVPTPVTEGHARPFGNEIEAEIVNRHLIGHWKNTSDERYFGTIHLAVLTGEDVMEGTYTSFAGDIIVVDGSWKWVRIDPATLAGVDMAASHLRPAAEIHAHLAQCSAHDGALPFGEIVEAN